MNLGLKWWWYHWENKCFSLNPLANPLWLVCLSLVVLWYRGHNKGQQSHTLYYLTTNNFFINIMGLWPWIFTSIIIVLRKACLQIFSFAKTYRMKIIIYPLFKIVVIYQTSVTRLIPHSNLLIPFCYCFAFVRNTFLFSLKKQTAESILHLLHSFQKVLWKYFYFVISLWFLMKPNTWQ